LTTSRRTCPACARRYAGLITPDCAVCWGVGVIGLGPAALHRSEPAVVARSIELYLEAASRTVAADLPLGDERRDALAAAADELRVAGVIADSLAHGEAAHHRADAPEGAARRVTDSEAARMAHLAGARLTPSDAANLDAEAIEYGLDDRPLAKALPVVSASGSQSFLARAADPADPLGDTRQQVYARDATERRAVVLSAAVGRVGAIKARRARRGGD
jgi:hypothetical protein